MLLTEYPLYLCSDFLLALWSSHERHATVLYCSGDLHNYRGYLRKWVTPRWGDQALDQVKAVAVESWLSALKKDNGTALADGSKKKIRDLMHLLDEHAIRYERTDRNPT